jgi:uncharacterized RDD family membrane protein YckC
MAAIMTIPASSTKSSARQRSMLGHYAGFASRLLAFTIDVLIMSITIVFTSWFVRTSVNMLFGPQIMNSLAGRNTIIADILRLITNPALHSVVSVIYIITYYLFFWTTMGQTPGKYLMGVKGITKHGHKLKLKHAIARYLGYYVSSFTFGLGFLWILVDDERRGWHDRIAGTLVIYVWDARPDETFLVRVYNNLRHRQDVLRTIIQRKKRQE